MVSTWLQRSPQPRVHSLQAVHSREGEIQRRGREEGIRANNVCTFRNTSAPLLFKVWSHGFECYFCLARASCQNIQPYSSNSVIIVEHNLLPGNLLLFLWHCLGGESYPLPRIASPPVWVPLKAFPWFQPQLVSKKSWLNCLRVFLISARVVASILKHI